MVETIATWPRRRATYDSLARLTDRELADIGLTRGDIGHVFEDHMATGKGANDNGGRQAA